MSDKVKRAELLPGFVHLGQKRQDGEDYIKHCERIVHKLASDFFDNNLSQPMKLYRLQQIRRYDLRCVAS